MKTKNINHLIQGALVAPFFVFTSGCSMFGLYSESQVDDIAEEFRQRGFDEGRGGLIRIQEHEDQREAAEKQVQERYYTVPVEAHVNEDGVLVDRHYVPIKILVEKE